MDKEFKKWMKWYGKKHGEYTVSRVIYEKLSVFGVLLINMCCYLSDFYPFFLFALFFSAGERGLSVGRVEGKDCQHKVVYQAIYVHNLMHVLIQKVHSCCPFCTAGILLNIKAASYA